MALHDHLAADRPAAVEDIELHRTALTGYCYRMLGSVFEADDAVQETMVRAWRSFDSFEGRAALRSWLYRIATNVCLDLLRDRKRRARPMDLGPAGTVEAFNGEQLPENTWLTPIPDGRAIALDADPAEVAVARETLRLAFVNALQLLPPRQRAVLVLREVLRWRAAEVAELLDTTEASVNSALQRARATLGSADVDTARGDLMDDSQQQLLARYVDAFERFDVPALVSLLREDAVQSMPPYTHWLVGPEAIAGWMRGPGIGCEGSRLLPTMANGAPAFGQYRADGQGGHAPWALVVLEITGDRITGVHNFLDTSLFAEFGLPAKL
jgi:RNA polymerase sigma-70 factor (ECF subfamily)